LEILLFCCSVRKEGPIPSSTPMHTELYSDALLKGGKLRKKLIRHVSCN